MRFKLSKTDIRFLNSVRFYTSGFFILPNFNFRTNQIENSMSHKIFSLIFSIFYIGFLIAWIYMNYKDLFPKLLWITKVIIIIIDCSSLLMFCVSLYSIFVKKNRWEKFFKSLRLIDVMLQNKDVDSSPTGRFLFVFILGHLFVLAFCFFYIYNEWFVRRRNFVYIIPSLSSLHFFSTSTIIADILSSINMRYDLIHDYLSRINKKEDSIRFSRQVEKGKALFELNGMIVNLFNKIFGWHILIIQCRTIATILRNLDLIVVGFDWRAYSPIAHILMSLILVVSTIF